MKEIANKHGISQELVKKIVNSPYQFISETSSSMELERNLDEENFGQEKTNFNIPCIGKLYASFYIYKRINKINEEND